MAQQQNMTFLDHLEVLRWHLIRSVIAIGVFAITAFVFSRYIFDNILLAPKSPGFVTYRVLCSIGKHLGQGDVLCISEMPFNLINTEMSGQFTTDMMVSFFTGFILALPYVLWEFWRFLKPALREKERRSASGFVFVISGLFFIGVLFGYYVIFPLSVNFLSTYHVSELVENQIMLGSYISLAITLTLSSGAIFELPVLVYVLSRLGVVTPELMKKYRKHSIVAILVLAGIITPPDVVSQVLVSIPLLILYEAGIAISRAVVRKEQLS